MKKAVFKAWRTKHALCLYPSNPACGRDAIAAYSIQNSGVLSQLSDGGHVYMIEIRPMFGDPLELPDFERRGRNQATTFKGLCNRHDTDLFLPIDTQPLNLVLVRILVRQPKKRPFAGDLRPRSGAPPGPNQGVDQDRNARPCSGSVGPGPIEDRQFPEGSVLRGTLSRKAFWQGMLFGAPLEDVVTSRRFDTTGNVLLLSR